MCVEEEKKMHDNKTAVSGQSLPQDPVILLSYINTQLRDQYPSLEELCRTLGADEASIRETLAGINYVYDAGQNQFV